MADVPVRGLHGADESGIISGAGAPLAAPANASEVLYLDTTNGVTYYWDGVQWNAQATGTVDATDLQALTTENTAFDGANHLLLSVDPNDTASQKDALGNLGVWDSANDRYSLDNDLHLNEVQLHQEREVSGVLYRRNDYIDTLGRVRKFIVNTDDNSYNLKYQSPPKFRNLDIPYDYETQQFADGGQALWVPDGPLITNNQRLIHPDNIDNGIASRNYTSYWTGFDAQGRSNSGFYRNNTNVIASCKAIYNSTHAGGPSTDPYNTGANAGGFADYTAAIGATPPAILDLFQAFGVTTLGGQRDPVEFFINKVKRDGTAINPSTVDGVTRYGSVVSQYFNTPFHTGVSCFVRVTNGTIHFAPTNRWIDGIFYSSTDVTAQNAIINDGNWHAVFRQRGGGTSALVSSNQGISSSYDIYADLNAEFDFALPRVSISAQRHLQYYMLPYVIPAFNPAQVGGIN